MNDLDPKVRGLVPKLFRDPKVRGLVPNLPPEHEPEPTGAAEPQERLLMAAWRGLSDSKWAGLRSRTREHLNPDSTSH